MSRVHTLLSQEVKVSSQVSFHKAEEREWEIARFGACRLLFLDWVWVTACKTKGGYRITTKTVTLLGWLEWEEGWGEGTKGGGGGRGPGKGRWKCKHETIDFVYLWSQSPVPQQTRLYPVPAQPRTPLWEPCVETRRPGMSGKMRGLGRARPALGLTETHSQWIRQRRELHKDATKSNRLGWLTVSDHGSTVKIILGPTTTTMPVGTHWVPYSDVCGRNCHIYIYMTLTRLWLVQAVSRFKAWTK